MKDFQGYTKQTVLPHLDREMPLITKNNYVLDGGAHLLNNVQSPEEIKKQRLAQTKKKYDQLLQKVEFFEHDQYERTYIYEKGLIPYIYFWKALARKPEGTEEQIKSTINRLKIWVPDTIVIGDEEFPPMWFYSSPEGYVFRTDTFTTKHISAKLSNYASPDELVAVFKKPGIYEDGDLNGNEVKLSSARECHQMTGQAFQEQVGIQVIQKYVKSNGPKAFICRTVWRKNQNAYSWIITNKADYFPNENIPNYNAHNKNGMVKDSQKYLVQPRIMGSCTIVNTCRGKYVDETVPYIQNILRYLDIQIGVKFKEFVADFVKDESGIWWMINVKAFKLLDHIDFVNLKPITNYGEIDYANLGQEQEKTNKYAHTKMKTCKYCEINMPETDLNYKMTLKMIMQTDRHLMHRNKGYSWLKRSDIKSVDSGILYEEHKVCVLCYKIYSETEKLLQTEHDFAVQLGIPCAQESRYEILNINQQGGDDENDQPGAKDMYGGNLNTGNVPSDIE